MWIFGYGSLMWDNWQVQFDYTRKIAGSLDGWRRAFAKASIVNWGTKAAPGPTLTLVETSGASCQGTAFEFLGEREAEIRRYLERREGKNFSLQALPVRLSDGETVTANVAIYTGPLIQEQTSAQIAAMALLAAGTSGTCVSYIEGIKHELDELGVADPEVDSICNELKLGQKKQTSKAG